MRFHGPSVFCVDGLKLALLSGEGLAPKRRLPVQHSLRQGVADKLHQLHQNNNDRHHDPGDFVLEPIVAVHNSDLTQTSSAHIPGHGGHIDHADHDEGVAQDQRSERFGDHHGEQNPQLGGTHRAG